MPTPPGLERAIVVYPGETRYPLAGNAEAVPLRALADDPSLFGEELP